MLMFRLTKKMASRESGLISLAIKNHKNPRTVRSRDLLIIFQQWDVVRKQIEDILWFLKKIMLT